MVHPYVGAGVGAMLFGDTLRVASVGGVLDVLAGVEFELTETLSLTTGVQWRLFTLSSFESEPDGVGRV